MKIKILKAVPGSLDGMKTREFEADEIVEIAEHQPRAVELAQSLIRAGFAVEVSEAQAAAHVEALSKLSPADAAARKAEQIEAVQLERAESKAAKREAKKKKKSEPAPAPEAPKAEPQKSLEPAVFAVGDVVRAMEDGKPVDPLMTITKIETTREGPEIVCEWFDPKDETKPFSSLFLPGDLVLVKVDPPKGK